MKQLLILAISMFSVCCAMDGEKWDAELYDENSKVQYQASMKNLEQFDLSLPQFKTIVELGCNTANVSNTLAQRYPEKTFVGIDPARDAITFGGNKHSETANLKLVCSTAQTFQLRKYDVSPAHLIFCYHVLHWIPRKELSQVFSNIADNLDTGGIVDISTSLKQEVTTLSKAVKKTLLRPKWWRYVPFCLVELIKGQNNLTLLTSPELYELVKQADLTVDRCEEVDEVASFASQEEFTPWLMSILKPHGIQDVFKEREQEFVNDAVDLYCSKYNPATDGTIEYRIKGLHLTAHRS